MKNYNDYNDAQEPWETEKGNAPAINFSGVAWDEHEEARYEGGGTLPSPEPGNYVLRITEVKTGIQQKGNNAGAAFFTTKCQVVEDDGTVANEGVWKFCGMGLTPSDKGYKQISETKAFLKDIGRTDMMEPGTDLTAADLVATEFAADVYMRKNNKTGDDEGRLKNIEPVSHKVKTPPPAPQPARPKVGRSVSK